MTAPDPDFDWSLPTAAEQKKLLEHHAADVLREVALEIGRPGWEPISRGEVAAYLQGRANRLDSCTVRNADGTGPLVCREHGPHNGHVFEGSSVPQLDDTEAMGDLQR